MTLSALTTKSHEPTDTELRAALADAYRAWWRFIEIVSERIPPIESFWAFSGTAKGWGLRLRRKGRIIVYLTPGQGSFLVSFALGEKAVAAAGAAKLPVRILKVIDAAPRYAEGRGVRFAVKGVGDVEALARLAEIKNGK